MEWVLIIYLYSADPHGLGAPIIEGFKSKYSCEQAFNQISHDLGTNKALHSCILKDKEGTNTK